MPKLALSLLPLLLLLPVPALSQDADVQEAWTASDGSLRARAAGISLPQTVAGLSLSKSGEVTNGGKGIDNYAQYLSDDGAVQATLYVYLPSYADASIAAYMTDRAVTDRFGPKTRRTAYEGVALHGKAGRAIRAVYDDAANGALTTAAAFVQSGRWLVKLRVTGPSERRREVLAGLDGMLSGLRFDDASAVRSISPARFVDCPKEDDGDARLTASGAATGADVQPVWEGAASFCIRGHVQTSEGSYDVMEQQRAHGASVIVPIDDAGTVMAFDPASGGRGYQLSMHSVGETKLYGVYDRVPSTRQIAQILDGKDPQTAEARATAAYAASGEVIVREGATN
ncbi:hypothetical protein [Sphingobium agri]|uniref:Uncharacterized protein n=1 Tax=Sphingobium agri TaxID=2933566 RepID=A0ABT0DW83_9SPHN|nr:hypothetical protein [Sphingobium agri]MCK0531384.1 hypothetical protein [Sphingobium agri]